MSTGDALVRLGRPDEARAPLEQALAMAERDGNMLPALDARIVLAQAAIATGDARAAAAQLSATFAAASEHQFKNVLADGVVTAARLLLLVSPGASAKALDWAQAVASSEEIADTVRRDARTLLEGQKARAPASAAGALGERIDEARSAVEALARA